MNPHYVSQIPDRAAGLDVASLPLDAREAFVLSQIDGRIGVDELADLLNQDPADVLKVIERLISLGAVVWSNVREPAPNPSSPPEEEVDLDPERRLRILRVYESLGTANHYEVLGVPREADKQEIRTAYFQLSKVFHPDTLFGRRLGSYKPKMEAVFKRLTEAYEVLGKKKAREEYDAYLAARDSTRLASRALDRRDSGVPPRTMPPPAFEAPSSPPSAVHVRHSTPEARRPTVPPVSAAPSSVPPAAPTPGSVPPARVPSSTPPPTPTTRSSIPPGSDEAARIRRDRAARRLSAATGRAFPQVGSNPAIPVASSSGGSSDEASFARPPVTREHVLRGLATSLHQAAQLTGQDAFSRYRQNAVRSEEKGDLVGAANSLRLALAASPDDAATRAEYERVQKLLAAQLAPTFETQANYEEKHGRWAEAAASWARVSEGRPNDPEPALRAAHALIEAGGDLRRAKTLAQRAVELAPENARARAILARIFLRANMRLNARRELDYAAKLDPSDELVKNLQRKMENGMPGVPTRGAWRGP